MICVIFVSHVCLSVLFLSIYIFICIAFWFGFFLYICLFVFFFFFFKQKTAYEMRISDWSSDVCSSDLDLQSLTSPQVVDHVVSREVELGVVYGPVANPEVETQVLVRSGIACIMRESHPLARHRRVRLSDLAGHSVITYLPQTILRNRVDEALRKAGVVPDLKVQVALSITGIGLAYHDAGVALVEPFLIETLGLTGLVARPFSPEIAVETLLVRHRSTPPSRLAGAFTAHFKRLLKRSRRNYRTV